MSQKSKYALIFVITLIVASSLSAQEQWSRRYGLSGSDRAYAMAVIPEGCMLTGRTTSFSPMSFEDVFLMKVEPSGDTLYWKVYLKDSTDERAYAIDVASNQGYVMAGFAEARDTGDADIYIVRTDQNANVLWSKAYGGEGQDTAYSVTGTPDGGFMVAGFTTSFGEGGSDAWILRTDGQGDTLWSALYGGSTYDAATCIIPAQDEGYVVTGWHCPEEGNQDIYVFKIDTLGNLVWERTYGGEQDDMGYAIAPTSDGGYVVEGCTWSRGAGLSDIWLLKIDASGDTLWTRTYGGPNYESTVDNNAESFSVSETSDGGYIVLGSTRSFGSLEEDVYLVKTNASGDTVWTKRYGGDNLDVCYSVAQMGDEGYLMAGRTRSFGSVRCDIYIIRTDSLGVGGISEPPQEPPFRYELTPVAANAADITYSLPYATHVSLKVYNVTGRLVTQLADGEVEAGVHTLRWEGRDNINRKCSSGVYFVRMETKEYKASKKMVLLK